MNSALAALVGVSQGSVPECVTTPPSLTAAPKPLGDLGGSTSETALDTAHFSEILHGAPTAWIPSRNHAAQSPRLPEGASACIGLADGTCYAVLRYSEMMLPLFPISDCQLRGRIIHPRPLTNWAAIVTSNDEHRVRSGSREHDV